MATTKQVFYLLSEILQYPQDDLVEKAREVKALLSEIDGEAAQEMDQFLSYAQSGSPGVMEELYTSTFDLNPVCSPYIGYHLFGESFKRGAFLVNVNEALRQHGIDVANELPDHLALVLRLYAEVKKGDLADDLRDECLMPVIDKMEQAFGKSENVYRKILRATRSMLEMERDKTLAGGPVDA